MVRLNLVQVSLGLVLIIYASGCSGPPRIDLSPDGKTIAEARPTGLAFYDGVHSKPTFVSEVGNLDYPRYSPDGSLLVAVQTIQEKGKRKDGSEWSSSRIQTDVLTKGGHVLFFVPDVGGPYAWRPDGSELVGITEAGGKNDVSAAVIHLKSHEVVRRYPIHGVPSQIVWLGNTRDLAVSVDKGIGVIHDGVWKAFPFQSVPISISYDRKSDQLMWVQSIGTERGPKAPLIELQVCASHTPFNGEATVLTKTNEQYLMNSSGRFAWATGAEVAPDGSQLAVAGIVDASKPGLLARYFQLAYENKGKPPSKKAEEEIKRIEDRLTCVVVCSTIPLAAGAGASQRRFTSSALPLLATTEGLQDRSVFWQDGGKKLVFVFEHKIHVL